MRYSACLSTVLLALAFLTLQDPAPAIELQTSQAKVGRFERIEFSLRLDGTYSNPFDPEEVDLSLRVTAPSGAMLSVPAFWRQDCERRRIPEGRKARDWFYPSGEPGWKARFAPAEVGRYRVVAVCRDRKGTGESQPVEFDSVASQRQGFVRISKKDSRYLELDNGQPLLLIGQNLAFIGESQYVNLARAEEVMAKLAANGANFLRVWVCCKDWATAIEAEKSAWGRSWEAKPPIVPLPGREGDPKAPKCLKLSEKPATASPSHPVAVLPGTRYVLSGKVRTEDGAKVRISSSDLKEFTVSGQGTEWSDFSREFTTGPNQLFLDRITFRCEGQAAWLDGLALRPATGGPNLLVEADVNRPARGYYHPVDCFIVDQLVEAAQRHGIYLELCFLERDLYMGALKDPKSQEYQQAIHDAKRTVRYAAARWGYATSVAMWEYVNEMDPGLPTDLWYDELGKEFEAVDPFHHLRATSAWGHSPKDWRHPRLDVPNAHHYLRPTSKESFKDEVEGVLGQLRYMRKNTPPGRPLLMAEFGLADDKWGRSPYMKQDQDLSHFHNVLWASALSGAAGTAQFWWWEGLDEQDAYRHYKPLAAFLSDIPLTSGLNDLSAKVVEGKVRPVGLQGKDRAYVWCFNPQATWWNVVVEKAQPAAVQGATIEIQGLASGNYRIEWWDTNSGAVTKRQSARVSDTLRLVVPEFTRDIACKVLPER
jgi:hypothetical protein